MKLTFLVAAIGLALVGCAGPVDVTRVVTPADAAAFRTTKLHPAAIVRGEARAELPAGALVDATEVRVVQPDTFVYPLDEGETVERNKAGQIIAVKTPGDPPTLTNFIAGTAVFEDNQVRGELEGHEQHVPLLATDKIELKGTLVSGDTLPNGGTVETSRAVSALVFGAVALGLGWLPSLYVAASSSVGSDGWLAVPGFGPWIALAARPECIPDPSTPSPTCLDDGTSRIGLVADGILQTAGLALLIFGIPSHTEITWSKDAKLQVVPMFGVANGLTLRGTF
ncbi:hypothetical protein BH09MYX1_BH09MYX1_62000 [soil metagenome]